MDSFGESQTKMRYDRLKFLRENSGHTQESFAQALGRDIKQVWRWETGKAAPSADALVDLAKVLDVSTDYLLGIIDEPSMVVSSELNEIELEAVALFRSLSARDQAVTLAMMKYMTATQEALYNIVKQRGA